MYNELSATHNVNVYDDISRFRIIQKTAPFYSWKPLRHEIMKYGYGIPVKHTISPTYFHFTQFLDESTATAHQMWKKIIYDASLKKKRILSRVSISQFNLTPVYVWRYSSISLTICLCPSIIFKSCQGIQHADRKGTLRSIYSSHSAWRGFFFLHECLRKVFASLFIILGILHLRSSSKFGTHI